MNSKMPVVKEDPPEKRPVVRRRKSEIRGNTLRVYLYLLRNGPSELRAVQRGLDLSTASLAAYHLERLSSSGLASQDAQGRYVAAKEAAGELLEGFTRIGALVVPQLLFFAMLFTPTTIYFAYMSIVSPSYVPLLIGTASACVLVMWYQTYRIWRALSKSS